MSNYQQDGQADRKSGKSKRIFLIIGLILLIAIAAAAMIERQNFKAYKNQEICRRVESDTHSVVASLASYYAVPSHEEVPTVQELKKNYGLDIQSKEVQITGKFPNLCVSITDSTGKCPQGNKYTRCFDDDTGTWR